MQKEYALQKGFTLVELVVVLVLVGVLAAVAIPRFIDLGTGARQSATNAVAASLTAVSSSNYAKRTANSSAGSAVTDCTNVGSLLSGGLPSGYAITSTSIANGASVTCTLKGPGSTTASFTGRGIT